MQGVFIICLVCTACRLGCLLLLLQQLLYMFLCVYWKDCSGHRSCAALVFFAAASGGD